MTDFSRGVWKLSAICIDAQVTCCVQKPPSPAPAQPGPALNRLLLHPCHLRPLRAPSPTYTHVSPPNSARLQKTNPPGDTVLECYASGSRNVFLLGFVPVRSENTVVLLARDTPPNCPAIKELDLDLSQWQAIIEDRAFVNWLVKTPTGEGVTGGGKCGAGRGAAQQRGKPPNESAH